MNPADYTTDPLRHVRLDGHELLLYDIPQRPRGLTRPHHQLGYVLSDPEGTVIFKGEDFGCSPMVAIDSDECLRSLLGFLTLRDGDVEDEYWKDHGYGELQLAWRDQYAEELQMWALYEEEGGTSLVFEDLMEW